MVDINAPLRRSRSDAMIGGVVSGLARYFGLDVTLARVLYVLGSIFSAAFPGILVYIILWILIPAESDPPRNVTPGPTASSNGNP